MLGHEDIPDDERRTMKQRAETTIRLIYYDRVRGVFQRQHERLIAAGYAATGSPPPDFGRLDRKSALGEVRRFLASLRPDASEDAKRLVPLLSEGLRDLNPRLVPANWIE